MAVLIFRTGLISPVFRRRLTSKHSAPLETGAIACVWAITPKIIKVVPAREYN